MIPDVRLLGSIIFPFSSIFARIAGDTAVGAIVDRGDHSLLKRFAQGDLSEARFVHAVRCWAYISPALAFWSLNYCHTETRLNYREHRYEKTALATVAPGNVSVDGNVLHWIVWIYSCTSDFFHEHQQFRIHIEDIGGIGGIGNSGSFRSYNTYTQPIPLYTYRYIPLNL